MEKLNLNNLRKQIDKVNLKLVKILAERFVLTRKVGIFKKQNKLNSISKTREKKIFEKIGKHAKKLKVDPILIKKIFELIIKKVRQDHRRIK